MWRRHATWQYEHVLLENHVRPEILGYTAGYLKLFCCTKNESKSELMPHELYSTGELRGILTGPLRQLS